MPSAAFGATIGVLALTLVAVLNHVGLRPGGWRLSVLYDDADVQIRGVETARRALLQQERVVSDKRREYLAMCLVIKDQQEEVREWLEHYLRLGASRVYVIDHASTCPVISHIADFVDSGVVEYSYITNALMWPVHRDSINQNGHICPQCWVYHECLARYGHRHQWMAFFDSDEFLLLRNRTVRNLPSFLKSYEEYGGLVVNWRTFGSSGHVSRPNGSVLANYWACNNKDDRMNRFIKTIANTNYAKGPRNEPHAFSYSDDKFAVNEKFDRVDYSVAPYVSTDHVVLNHYVSKSLEQNEAKVKRGAGHGGGKSAQFFINVDRAARENCSDAVTLMDGRRG